MSLQKLELIRFRGFDSFLLSGLSPFTVIAGRNNVGKTSILEAIYYLAQRNLAITPGQLTVGRQIDLARRELTSLFWNMDDDVEISIRGEFTDGAIRFVGLEKSKNNPVELNLETSEALSIDEANQMPVYVQRGFGKDAAGREMHTRSFLYFTKSMYKAREQELEKNGVRDADSWDDKWACFYYLTRGMQSRTKLYELLFHVKKEQSLLKGLQWIDNRVKDIVFAGDRLLVDVGAQTSRLPVEVMGDGMVKVADVLTLVSLAKPGDVVCIDEIENGLHYSVLTDFISALVEVSRSNGVQIVMTTHSREFLSYLADEALESQLDEEGYFSFKNLIRNEPTGFEQVDYDYKQFAEAIREGMEVR